MMRSLSSAVGGLRAHQTKMDVIGTNIANVNTYGFKSSRVTFSDVYYQTLSSGSQPMTSMGGTNPTQIGYGAMVATIDVLNSQSGLASTDRALDLYINGDGMIAVKDANGNLMYTRLGVLGFDAEGNLVDANGNFVMGFPMNADGTAKVNPDGSVDIEELSKITVLPEMLDQLTNISIGPTGEIIGTLPGETSTTQNSKTPSWLVSAEPILDDLENHPVGPYIQGDIKVTMEYKSELASSTTLPTWITSLTAKSNSKVDGGYDISYDKDSNQIRVSQNGEVLYTGTYVKNGTINLTNAKGETVMTIKTDPYNSPADGQSDSVDFTRELTLTVSYTDQGGNKYTESTFYDEVQIEMTIGDIKLKLDPTAVETAKEATLSYNTSNIFANDWLQSVYLSDSAQYSAGDVTLAAGVSQTVTFNYTANDSLSFLTQTELSRLVKDLNVTGSYYITTVESQDSTGVPNGFRVVISYGTEKITSNLIQKATDPITFDDTYAGDATFAGNTGKISDTYTIGTMDTSHFTTTTTASSTLFDNTGLDETLLANYLGSIGYTGKYSVGVTGTTLNIYAEDGSTILGSASLTVGSDIEIGGTFKVGTSPTSINAQSLTEVGTRTSRFTASNKKFATLSEKNTIQLIDENGTVLEEVVYNGAARVPLGDLTLLVDKDALNAYFSGRQNIESASSQGVLGTISQDDVYNWLWDANVANAQPGAGESFLIGNIALAKIPNMAAMEQTGNSYFVTSPNSGDPTFVKPGINNTGTLTSGYLEMSNVDISKEFTDMITTQRGFQANTRIITVSDEMLQELVNLKR